MSSLPAAVQIFFYKQKTAYEIVKIEKKTEEGKTVYEAVVNKKGKEWSIEVDANGKFLKEYQESKEKEEKGEKYESNRDDSGAYNRSRTNRFMNEKACYLGAD